MPQKTYPTEFKIEVVKYYKCHHTVAETLTRYGIAESTLFRWKHEYESRRFLRLGKSGEADKRAPLQSHVTKMEQIVEVLSICNCGVNASNDEKMEAIKSLEGQYSIHVLCEALLLHSDQGVQYTASAFRSHLKKLKVKQSFSSPGVPYDNSVCESFFHRLKNESIYRSLYSSADELSAAVDEYITFYNDYRPHRTLKMKTPSQYETEFYSKIY